VVKNHGEFRPDLGGLIKAASGGVRSSPASHLNVLPSVARQGRLDDWLEMSIKNQIEMEWKINGTDVMQYSSDAD
jgi:hypothetical protein